MADGKTPVEATGESVVFGENLPAAREAALQAAFQDAVRRVVGVLVKTESATQDTQLTYNRVVAGARGYIASYRVLSEKRTGNLLRVTIEAVVAGDRIRSAFADRLSKLVEQNPIGPCKLSANLTATKTALLSQNQIFCPVSDPTIDMETVRLHLPLAGAMRPRVFRSGTFTSLTVEGPALSADVVALLRSPGLSVSFVDPASRRETKRAVRVDDILFLIVVLEGRTHNFGSNIALTSLEPGRLQEMIRVLEAARQLLPDRTGQVTEPEGSVYVGELRGNAAHGRGRRTWSDGRSFEGHFRQGAIVLPERGALHFADGRKYSGGLSSSGLPEGGGRMTWPDSSEYNGQFRDGKMHGYGRLGKADGRIISGDFVSDEPHGRVTVREADGSRYTGTLRAGRYHGRGILSRGKGEFLFNGRFEDGALREGHGQLMLPGSVRYRGPLDGGVPTGKGTLTFANGDFYNGEVRRGIPHGPGTLVQTGGAVILIGLFVEGKLEGPGRRTDRRTGEYYKGEFRAGQPSGRGEGQVLLPDGRRWIGPMLDGKPHGDGRVRKGQEASVKARFENGVERRP